MKLRVRIGWICLAVVSGAILVFGVVASQSGKLLASARSSRFLLSYA